jgi:hypothetical protein
MSRRARIEPAMPATTKKLRCAVYTRKSTDEGLEKEFNTLDAQRDACDAYVASQRAEGWVLVRDHYDDGGFSGGTLERPALQRLLRDIPGGEDRRGGVAQVGAWRGGGCCEGLVEHGEFLRQGRGPGGFGRWGVLCRRRRGRRHRGRHVGHPTAAPIVKSPLR